MNTEKCYLSWDIFDNLELLMYMQYHLSFGSAKPTKREILMQQLILNRDNPRRFGTAKRLGKMMNTEKCYLSWDIFDNLELLMYMQYHLSFGSAKPTRGALWS